MHTITLMKILNSAAYYSILNSIPHTFIKYSSDSKKYEISNDRLQIDEEDKKNMPKVYLYDFMPDKKKEEDSSNSITYYMCEILVNCGSLFHLDLNRSVPAESIFIFGFKSVISLVCRAIPQLNDNFDRMVLYKRQQVSIWTLLENEYKSAYPEKPLPDKPFILKGLAESDNESVQETMHRLFDYPQVFAKAELETYKIMEWFNHNYPPEFKLKRIDYTYDMHTDYKSIYLKLIVMGYGLSRKTASDKAYYKDNEVVSIYIKQKSCRINIYDKFEQVSEKDGTAGEDSPVNKLLRFEVQVEKVKIINELRKRGKNSSGRNFMFISNFINRETEYQILEYYFRQIIGLGHYYTYTAAVDIVNASGYKESMKAKLCTVLEHVARRRGVRKFLECVKDGSITDCGSVQTAKGYLKKLHGIGVNSVTISREEQARMKAVKRETELEIPPELFRYPQYQYGVDFLPNPLWKLIFDKLLYESSQKNYGESNHTVDFTELANF